VGLDDKKENPLKVYPNPVDQQLNIELAGYHSFSIYSITGRLVFEESFTDKFSGDMSHLESGLYFYRIDEVVGRFIKR